MERNEILEKINEIARDVFDNNDVVITESSTAADVDGWDSLSHINLIGDIEDKFEIRFTLPEIVGIKNVGGLVDTIEKHIRGK